MTGLLGMIYCVLLIHCNSTRSLISFIDYIIAVFSIVDNNNSSPFLLVYRRIFNIITLKNSIAYSCSRIHQNTRKNNVFLAYLVLLTSQEQK